MTSYRYPSPSVIENVSFKKADNGTPRAYLHARDDATGESLAAIVKTLNDKGYLVVHSICDGRPALEVRGYMWERDLLGLLEEKSFATGKPQVTRPPREKKSLVQTVRDNSLPLASANFLAADFSYSMYGYKSARPEDVIAGGSYMIGSATMGMLGTHAQATAEIKKQAKKLLAYAKEHDLDLSHNVTLPAVVTEENKRSAFQNIMDTLQTYPAEIGNSFTALAGLLIAYASWKYRVGPNIKTPFAQMSEAHQTDYSAGLKDIGLGAMTFSAGMIGAWVKEKKHDPDQPPAQGLNAVWEWVQEKPLRVSGIGYMISTAFHTFSTIEEYRFALKTKDQHVLKAVPWRAGFIGFTILSELLLLISSKGHGEGVKSDPSTDESVPSLAAEMIVQQKPELQAGLIDTIGGFLGRADVLGGKDTDVKGKLAGHVEAMRRNPWLQAVETVKKQPLPSAEELPAWQAKLAAAALVPPVLGA